MKLVINLKLEPDAAQQRALQDTLERCNAACNWLSKLAFESGTFGQYALHKAHYYAMSGKQSRFQKITNHTISKKIVSKAKRLCLSIAVEELTGIRSDIKARKVNRNRLHNWSFADLRVKLGYKAMRAGIPCVAVNPRNTSKQCSVCGHIAKANRRSQAIFKCQVCGHCNNADQNAAVNIAARGALHVTRPYKFAHEHVPRAVESPRL